MKFFVHLMKFRTILNKFLARLGSNFQSKFMSFELFSKLLFCVLSYFPNWLFLLAVFQIVCRSMLFSTYLHGTVHFLFLLKPSFTCVITEEKFFFGNVTTLLFWWCDRYWYEKNCFLAMWQPIFFWRCVFLAMWQGYVFGDVTHPQSYKHSLVSCNEELLKNWKLQQILFFSSMIWMTVSLPKK